MSLDFTPPSEPVPYSLVAVKRWWIPERAYAAFGRLFGNTLGTQQPWSWILHHTLDDFTRRRMRQPGQTLRRGPWPWQAY
jgi:hypothetical protein